MDSEQELAEEAGKLIDNPAFQETVRRLKERMYIAWHTSTAPNKEEREHLYSKYNLLLDLQAELELLSKEFYVNRRG